MCYKCLVRILVIEDEKKTAAFLDKGLREAGFRVDIATNGGDGLNAARERKFDLLIVDVMLPGKDGWTVVEELRAAGSATGLRRRTDAGRRPGGVERGE